jgi:hypothetical protein
VATIKSDFYLQGVLSPSAFEKKVIKILDAKDRERRLPEHTPYWGN